VTTPPPVVTTTRPEPTPDPNGIIVDPCGDGKVYQGYSMKEGLNDWEEDHKFSRVIRDRKTPKEERLCHPNSDIFVNEEGQRYCFKKPDDPTERVGEMQYKVKCKSADESRGTTAITGTTASTETTASTDSTVSSGTADDDRDDVRQSLLTDIQDGLDVIRSDKQQGTEERENKVKKELDNLTSYNSLV